MKIKWIVDQENYFVEISADLWLNQDKFIADYAFSHTTIYYDMTMMIHEMAVHKKIFIIISIAVSYYLD